MDEELPQPKLSGQCHLHVRTTFARPAQGAEGPCPKLPKRAWHRFPTRLQNHHGSSWTNQVPMKNLDHRAEHGEKSEFDQLTQTIGHTST